MTGETDLESDFCDLTPGKICDNCCRCLDLERDYNEVEASLLWTDRIEDGDRLDMGPYAHEGGEEDLPDEEVDSSRVAPIEIDPALMAEWEGRLRAYEAEQKMAYIHTLRGARKRPGKERP